MSLSCFVSRCCAVVSSIARRIARCVVRTVHGLVAAVRVALCAGLRVGQAARRYPVKATATVVATGLAWSFFGWTPLLAVACVVALLYAAAKLVAFLLLWRATRSALRLQHPPVQPQRNGQRLNRSAHSKLAPVS